MAFQKKKKEEFWLTHAGLAKILLVRFAFFFLVFFSIKQVLSMFMFKITIILNTISSNIATHIILIKENPLVLHTQEILLVLGLNF